MSMISCSFLELFLRFQIHMYYICRILNRVSTDQSGFLPGGIPIWMSGETVYRFH